MVKGQPHFLLFTGAEVGRQSGGRWHFALESIDGRAMMEASDAEPGWRTERLELLAVVRGLEALEQPSRVTLVTSSRRVSRGLRFGIEQWRHNRWRWERDGRWVPIKNRDLWQRVDRALEFHHVECRTWRIDRAHATPAVIDAVAEPVAIPRPAHPVRRPHFLEKPKLGQRVAAAVRSWLTIPNADSGWNSASSLSG